MKKTNMKLHPCERCTVYCI